MGQVPSDQSLCIHDQSCLPNTKTELSPSQTRKLSDEKYENDVFCAEMLRDYFELLDKLDVMQSYILYEKTRFQQSRPDGCPDLIELDRFALKDYVFPDPATRKRCLRAYDGYFESMNREAVLKTMIEGLNFDIESIRRRSNRASFPKMIELWLKNVKTSSYTVLHKVAIRWREDLINDGIHVYRSPRDTNRSVRWTDDVKDGKEDPSSDDSDMDFHDSHREDNSRLRMAITLAQYFTLYSRKIGLTALLENNIQRFEESKPPNTPSIGTFSDVSEIEELPYEDRFSKRACVRSYNSYLSHSELEVKCTMELEPLEDIISEFMDADRLEEIPLKIRNWLIADYPPEDSDTLNNLVRVAQRWKDDLLVNNFQ